jgi:outer membrane receptor for ferrienterochelin and colicins
MMRGSVVSYLALVLALGAGSTLARAQTSEPPVEAEEAEETQEAEASEDLGDLESLLGEQVVTTASRSAARASAAPATVVTIDGNTMRRYGIRSVDEALAYLGLGTFVSDSGRDYTSGVDTGVQGVLLRDRNKHVLVLLDGHVMNAQSSGETRLDVGLGVPLEIIDHIEVMLGPGSVSYGSNAMMAVLNVVTLRARDYGRLRIVSEGTLSPPHGIDSHLTAPGDGNRMGGRYRVGMGFARTGTFLGRPAEVLVHAEWQQEISSTLRVAYLTEDRDFAPTEPGWGGVTRFESRAPSIYVRARVGDASLFLQGNSYYRTTPLLGTFADPANDERVTNVRGELRHDVVLSAHTTLASRLYGDHVRTEESSAWTRYYFCLPGQQLDGCRFVRRNASSWVGLEEQLVVDWRVDGRFVTTVGADLRFRSSRARPADYYDRVTGDPPWSATLPFWKSQSVLGAVFVQQVMRFGDHWTVNVGARFDGDSLYGVHLSPRAAVMFLPTPRTTIRVGYSEAFRAPSAQDLYDTDPTYVIRPTSLGAETVRALDVEVAQRFAHGSLSLRGFASRYDGLVVQRVATDAEFAAAMAAGGLVSNADPAYVTRWDNLEVVDSIGGTLSGSYEPISGFEIGSNLTLATNQIGNTGPLYVLPRFYGNAHVSYRFGDDKPTIAVVSAFSSRRYAGAEPGDTPIPAISAGPVGDIRVIASGPLHPVQGLTWRMAVHTALNNRGPYVYSSGPPVNASTEPRMLAPVQRLYVFVGIQYDLR